ncbi:hypothetical protein IFM89_020880 [Coptis chinensis]|uniref:anthranilate synthase n=1 Tax=Coptis chinensis TaxID=261450 RepID=A0A835IX16_9MAGN|nr:hypothetical protein IFM89_020880 [Coptis chinensis]
MAAAACLTPTTSLTTPKNFLSTRKIRYDSLPIRNADRLTVKASLLNEVENSRVCVKAKKVESPIVVIDNYDSFTYNLCQMEFLFTDANANNVVCLVGEIYRNLLNALFCTLKQYELFRVITVGMLAIFGLILWQDLMKNPRGILISPGPGTPQDSGISLETVLKLGPILPVFGVCMGLQCIGEAFGGKVVRSPFGVVHGKSSLVYYDEKGEDSLFSGLTNPFTAGRYHSLVIEKESFPSDVLEVTAWTDDGLIMAARHKKYKHLQGVQFHPESIITIEGKTIVGNFIKLVERFVAESEK